MILFAYKTKLPTGKRIVVDELDCDWYNTKAFSTHNIDSSAAHGISDEPGVAWVLVIHHGW